MIKIVTFTVGSPDSSGDMSAEVQASILNTGDASVRWIQYRMILENQQGFPLASGEGSEDCRLEEGDSTDLFATCSIPSEAAGGHQENLAVRAVATTYSRDLLRIGEIVVPPGEFGSAHVEKAIEGSDTQPTVKVLVVRSKSDETGRASVECRALVINSGPSLLERVELRYELLDADESGLEAGEEWIVLPAGGIACIEASTSSWRPAQLKGARIRLFLGIYRPMAVVSCVGTSLASDDVDSADLDADTDDEDGSDLGNDDAIDDDADREPDLDHDSAEEGDASDGAMPEADCDETGLAGLDSRVMSILRAAKAMDLADVFRQNQITEDILETLSDVDLVHMGVGALGLRRRILAEIAGSAKRPSDSSTNPQAAGVRSGDQLLPTPRTTDWTKVVARVGLVFTGFDRVISSPQADHRKFVGALEYISASHRNLKPLLVYDDTFFGSGKDGLLVSDLGVHWRNLYQEPKFVSWSSLHSARQSGKAVELEPGGEISCAYEGVKCAMALASFINHTAGAAAVALSAAAHPQQGEVLDAVRTMQGMDQDGFVIVEDPATGRFVQFCNGELGPVLDIPYTDYTQAQRERASGFLEQCGFGAPQSNSESFQRQYGKAETGQMVSDALAALRGIHSLRFDIPLKITRGWS